MPDRKHEQVDERRADQHIARSHHGDLGNHQQQRMNRQQHHIELDRDLEVILYMPVGDILFLIEK